MKLDTLLRFAFIETRLYWEDGLAAKDLVEAFELSRPTAQAVIDDYRHRYPGQMRYDPAKKRHVMTEDFEPRYISERTLDFLDFLRGQGLREHYLEEKGWSNLQVYDVDRFLRPRVSREIMRQVLGALRHQKTLRIDYQAKMDDGVRDSRVISPNYLVFADNRYHLYAYCHTLNAYRDFVLSRIVWVEPAEEQWVSGEHSEEWREYDELYFQPNPQLPERARRALLRGYPDAEKGYWRIRCRRNATYYIEHQLEVMRDDDSGLSLWQKITPGSE